ncbi:MAG: hypothetical protein EBU01_02265, partial [Crocinitomicaceae bacterium]|nr:hypothetical protein [Crocinitomicaceae bacterium]
ELLGQGVLGSINYDRLIKVNKSVKMSFSFGAIYAPNIKTFQLREKYPYTYNFGLPVSCNLMIGKKNSYLDLGIGLSTFYLEGRVYIQDGFCGTHLPYEYNAEIKNFSFFVSPKIGYRYQRENGGLFIKATFNPMFNLLNVKNTYKDQRTSNKKTFLNKSENIILWPGISLGYTF